MDKKSYTYDSGVFTINNQILHLSGTTINIPNIDNLEFFDFKRHSIFAGLKDWLVGFVFMLIICSIWKKLMILGDIYICTIIILFVYNIKKHKEIYYGLKIETSRGLCVILKSDNNDFIHNVHDAIVDAMNSKNVNYTINFDSHDVINNGIISNGNKNKNKIEVNND